MNVGLLYICAFAGLALALGSLLLLRKGRVLVDSAKGEISEVELPLGFKLKTQQPILVIFLFGSFLLTMPIYTVRSSLNGLPKVAISGSVQNNGELRNLEAYAIIADRNITREVKFTLPQLEDFPYRIVYRDPKSKCYSFVFDQLVDLKQAADGTFNLLPFDVTNWSQVAEEKCQPRQGAAIASVINPTDIVREEVSVVGNFK